MVFLHHSLARSRDLRYRVVGVSGVGAFILSEWSMKTRTSRLGILIAFFVGAIFIGLVGGSAAESILGGWISVIVYTIS